MTAGETLRIPAGVERLEEARAFVEAQAARAGVDPSVLSKVDLVIEELLVNVGSYAYPDGEGLLELVCEARDLEGGCGEFCIMVRDWGVEFDPLSKLDPATDSDIESRPIGGLGIFLVKQIADSCAYERRGDMNEFKACFVIRADS
jgi:anti-sigma regulatory factor (Ser/Thr protein kinase)